MRQNLLKSAALLLLGSLCGMPAFAQSERREKNITKDETVIIKKDGDDRTVVEIKDGTVYVNGDAVVTVHDADAAKVHKKIIIENGDSKHEGGPQAQSWSFGNDGEFRDMPAPQQPRRAMLGVMTDPKSGQAGAVVKDVTPNSPAEAAGLKSGDVITRIDGKTIKDAGALVTEIGAQHEPGDRVTIIYERNGHEHTTSARLENAAPQLSMRSYRFNPDDMNGDLPNAFFKSFPFNAMDNATPTPKLGISAEDRADGDGVRVLSVKPGSPAAVAGFKEGDVITRVGEDKIGSVDELQMSIRAKKTGEKLSLEYQREGKTQTASVTLPRSVKRKDL